MRKIELSSALAASTISARSVSRTTMPSRVAGSNILTVPCMCGEPPPGLDDLAGLEAGRADIDALRRAVDDRAHALHVRVPPPLGAAVRVAEPHPEDRLLAAHVTHGGHPGKASTHYHPFLMLTSLSAADLRQAVLRFRDALRAHQEELNRLNVYPVPDGDTGTNMALTLESVSSELATAASMDEVCHAISRGSLMGARGNSGVITSQILRGLVEGFRTLDEIDGPTFAAGLRNGADAAYQAVMRPVEGTILTVVRESAEAVEAAGTGALGEMLERAFEAACVAVDKTPEQLPVLRDAGVVDAGGKGFTLLLAALLEVVAGRPIPEPETVTTPAAVAAPLAGEDVAGLRYEVMYLLDAEDATIPAFRDAWSAIGDSIV